MTYRNDLDALRARHDALETEVSSKQRELGEARKLIDEATVRAKLPVLDNIRIAAPCSADWSKMTGDERARACGDCNKNVYNLSNMTRDEAEALIIEKEGRLCVRYFKRADGTIMLKDCTIGIKKRRRRRIVAGATVLMAAAGFVGARANQKAIKATYEPVEEQNYVMGDIEPSMGVVALPEYEMGKMALPHGDDQLEHETPTTTAPALPLDEVYK